MATITLDAIKMKWIQDKEGFVVLFRLNPADEIGVAALSLAPYGSQFKMTLSDLDKEGNPTTEKEAPTEDTGTNATVTEKALQEREPCLQESAAPVSSRFTKESGRLCKDPRFQVFLRERYPNKWRFLNLGEPVEKARLIVHDVCDVKSRKEFLPGTPAGDRWEQLYGEYLGEMME